MVKHIVILLSLIAATSLGQVTVFRLDNNVSDLNPERDAISAVSGIIRITADINNGAGALNLSTADLPIPLMISHRTDGWTNPVASALETVAASGRIRWQFNLQPGEYQLKATATFPDDQYDIFLRYLSVTSPPVTTININSNAVQVSVPVTVTNITTINYYGGSVTNL